MNIYIYSYLDSGPGLTRGLACGWGIWGDKWGGRNHPTLSGTKSFTGKHLSRLLLQACFSSLPTEVFLVYLPLRVLIWGHGLWFWTLSLFPSGETQTLPVDCFCVLELRTVLPFKSVVKTTMKESDKNHMWLTKPEILTWPFTEENLWIPGPTGVSTLPRGTSGSGVPVSSLGSIFS